MRLSSPQIVVVAVLFVAGILMAVMAMTGSGSASGKPGSSDFLTKVRQNAEAGEGTEDKSAPLPGIGTNPGLVPQLRLETEAIEVGPIANDKFHLVQTTIYNDGSSDLVISSVDTECTCTEGRVENATIPPGKSAVMDIKLNPYLMPGFTTTKELTIRSNDPKRRACILPVTTHVDPEFSVSQAVVDFGNVAKGDTPSTRLHFKQVNDEPFAVTGVGSSEGQPFDFDASFEPVPEAEWETPGKAEFFVTVGLNQESAEGMFDRYLVVNNTTKRIPNFHVHILASIQSFYTIFPPANPIAVRGFAGSVTDIPLKVESDGPIEVTDLQLEADDFTIQIKDDDDPNTVNFELFASPEIELGERLVQFSFKVHGPNGEVVQEKRTLEVRAIDFSELSG